MPTMIQSTVTADASNVTVVPLKRTDYPHIRFWFKRDWTNYYKTMKAASQGDSKLEVARGKARSAKGINVMMLYIEMEDGQSVDGDVAADIRQTARTVWMELEDVDTVLPVTWGQMGEQRRKEYSRKMAETYPYIRLCHQDWKANEVATVFYPKWHKGRLNKDDPKVGSDGKRSRKDSTTTMQKRLRPDVVSGIQFYLSHNLPNLCNIPEVDPPFSVVASLDSEPGDAVNLDDFMPTTASGAFKLLPDYFAIPSAITGGPSTYSQAPPEMPYILKVSTLLVH